MIKNNGVSAAQETKILQTTKMVKIHVFVFFFKKKPAQASVSLALSHVLKSEDGIPTLPGMGFLH